MTKAEAAAIDCGLTKALRELNLKFPQYEEIAPCGAVVTSERYRELLQAWLVFATEEIERVRNMARAELDP